MTTQEIDHAKHGVCSEGCEDCPNQKVRYEIERMRQQEIEHRTHGVCARGCGDCPDQLAAAEREVVNWEIEQELGWW